MSVGKRSAMFYAALHVGLAERWGCGDRDVHERALDHLVDDNTEPEIVTDGGTDVDPVICDRLRRIYRRGPVIEEVAGLFGFDVDDVRVHLLGDCECRNTELAVSTLEGRQ